MFSVLFELLPEAGADDAYFGTAKMMRSAYESIEGFLDHIHYRSLRREKWILSLSTWEDEKALVRWRVRPEHHQVQEMGRDKMLADYRFRIGQVTEDTSAENGLHMVNQRLDESEIGAGVAITLITARNNPEWIRAITAEEIAEWLGFDPFSDGDCIAWDVYEDAGQPGDLLLLTSWKSHQAADAFSAIGLKPDDARFRRIRVIRDYGMFDRREAPQFFPDRAGRKTCTPDRSACVRDRQEGCARPDARADDV